MADLYTDAGSVFVSTVNPGPTDDSDAGYQMGHVWVNSTDKSYWTCCNASPGAAVWRNMSSGVDQVVVVAKSGGDFTSVAAAIASITDASSSKPYVIRIEPGVYTEPPFAMKQWVSVMGSESPYGVELITNDNNAHFITGNQNCSLSGVTITGPTGTGFACIRLNTGSTTSPFILESTFIKVGYYGVLVDGAYLLIATRVLNNYSGSAIQNLFRVTSGGDLVAFLSGCTSGPLGACAVTFYCEGSTSRLTLDACFSRGGTKGIYLDDGCTARIAGMGIDVATTCIEIGTLGTGTHIEASACVLQHSTTNHIVVGSATGNVFFSGIGAVSKMSVASGATFVSTLTDEVDGALTVLGEMKLGDSQGNLIALSQYAKDVFCTGRVSGGAVTTGTGNTVNVAAGVGYINNGTEVNRIAWSSATSVALAANAHNYVYINGSGTAMSSTSVPDMNLNIVLASVRTSGSAPIGIAAHYVLLGQHVPTAHTYFNSVIGPVFVSGCGTSKNATALQIDIDAGSYYVYDNLISSSGGTAVTFVYWYRDGGSGWTIVTGQTTIDDQNYDDGTGTLAAIPAGKYKKDISYITVGGDGTTFHVVYGQELFDAQDLAENGNNPTPPQFLSESGLRSGGIVVLKNAGVIASVIDARPIAAATISAGGGGGGVTDHGALTGLLDDDHSQYLPVSGVRAMTGGLNMGGNAITNVGNVDGVDVSAHKARHIQAGLDEIDGDKLDIDWNPTYYTPTTAPTEVDNVAHLTAHLAGIDNKLGGPGTDLPCVVARDSVGNVNIPLAWTDLNFDVTDLENNTAIIDHDNTLRDRITVKETGLYLISWSFECDDEIQVRVRVNDTTVVAGPLQAGDPSDINDVHVINARTVAVSLTANDFLTVQIQAATTNEALIAGGTFTVIRAKGEKGNTGATGPQGADGDITWEGAWVTSTAYTTNQAVSNYGSSYVCILNHTSGASSEPGIGASWTTYWEVLAAAGSASSLTVQRANSESNSATTSSTPVQKLRLTTTSLLAGAYYIGWSVRQKTDKSVTAVHIRVQVDDVTDLTNDKTQMTSATDYYPRSGFRVVPLTAGVHTVDLDHWTDSGSGVGSQVKEARLILWRVL